VIGRLVGICFSVLAAAMTIYVAIRLIESIAPALIVIGAIAISGFVGRLWWRRHVDRW